MYCMFCSNINKDPHSFFYLHNNFAKNTSMHLVNDSTIYNSQDLETT